MRIIQTADLTPQAINRLTHDEREWIYNGLDCCVTLEVLEKIKPQLDNVSGGTYSFSKDLQGPILDMTMRGILVNQSRRAQVSTMYERRIEKLADRLDRIIRDGIGIPDLNWRSPKQLITLFYDVMKLPVVRKRNAQGKMAPTVNRDAVERLSAYFIAEPVCNYLLALRDLKKKLDFLTNEIDSDGRMRTSFNIAGTNTGRLSSSISDFGTGGNLQNVDRELRSVFMSDPGMKFANLDLEQADSRNLGALCWNTFLEKYGEDFAGAYLEACESGDLHTFVCRMARPELNWPEEREGWRAVADQLAYRGFTYRDLDKRLGHGSNYLGTPRTMAMHTKVPVSAAEMFQRNYFAAFPCIPAYHDYVRQVIKESAMLVTLLNRRRFFYGRYNDDKTIRDAVAYGPQSMTADEINLGMLKVWRDPRVQLLVQVHDSILFQYPEELESEIVPWALEELKIPLELEGGRKFVVPTEAKVGWNWGDHTSEEDVAKGKAKIVNHDGLVKWKGSDTRKRTEHNSKLSILDM